MGFEAAEQSEVESRLLRIKPASVSRVPSTTSKKSPLLSHVPLRPTALGFDQNTFGLFSPIKRESLCGLLIILLFNFSLRSPFDFEGVGEGAETDGGAVICKCTV